MKEIIEDILKALGYDPVKKELVNVIYSAMAFFLYMLLGMIGAFSTGAARGRRFNKLEMAIQFGCSTFAGSMVYILAFYGKINPLLGGVLTSMACMSGKELCIAIQSIDYTGTLKEKFAAFLEHCASKLRPPKD